MSNAFTTAQAPRVRVALELRDQIQRGVYQFGDRLPTEDALTQTFGVSRPTVRASLDLLEQEGLIRRNESRARIVCAIQPPKSESPSSLHRAVAILGGHSSPLPTYQKQHGWWGYVQASTQAALSEARCHALLMDQSAIDDTFLAQLVEDRPKGLIMLRESARNELGRRILARFHEAGIPVVVCGYEPELAEYDMVGSNHRVGARDLTRFLIGRGRRRILRLWQSYRGELTTYSWFQQRDLGFRDGIAEAGLEELPPLAYIAPVDHPQAQAGYEFNTHALVGYLLKHLGGDNPVDAIMVPSDGLLFSVASACRILGREPGRDIDIVGYDNYWQDCTDRRWESYIPPATVDKRNIEVGKALVAMLMERSSGQLPATPKHLLIPPELILTEAAAPEMP